MHPNSQHTDNRDGQLGGKTKKIEKNYANRAPTHPNKSGQNGEYAKRQYNRSE